MPTNKATPIRKKDPCSTQADIYRKAAETGCDMQKFSNMYLNSNFCKGDTTKHSPEEALQMIFAETGDLSRKNSTKFDTNAAWWAGYTYYKLYQETGISESLLREKVPFAKLLMFYHKYKDPEDLRLTDVVCNQFGLKKKQPA